MEYKITKRITKELLDEVLEVKNTKGLTASSLLEKAKNKDSILHKEFEWDDNVASHKWRLYQARLLINDIKIIINEIEVYAFENVNVEKGEIIPQRQYLSAPEIMDDDVLRKQVLIRAKKHIKYWRDMYAQYEEFSPIFEVIDEVLGK